MMRKCHQNYSLAAKCCGKMSDTPKYALRGVSVGLRLNELLGLLGPNGAGKTTMMKLIVGEEAPFTGDIHLCGRPLTRQGAASFNKHLGYCPQTDSLWPRLSVAETLYLFARLRGLTRASAKEVVDAAMCALKIEKFAQRQFSALSGGTKRKVSFSLCIYITTIRIKNSH